LELEHRAVKPLFTAQAGDPIGGALDVSLQGFGWDYTIVVTRKFVQLLVPNGQVVWRTVVWRTACSPGFPGYHFTLAGQFKWALYLLATGLPGLLGFLCAREWPAGEPCGDCHCSRLVDPERCEHCGATFAPPSKNGMEIFEA